MLSRKQVRLLWIGVVLFLAMALFPPWEYTLQTSEVRSAKPTHYGLIFYPPPPEHDAYGCGVRIDFARLSIQWAATTLVIGAAMVTQRKPRA